MSTNETTPEEQTRSFFATSMAAAFLGHIVAWAAFLLIGYVVESAILAFELPMGLVSNIDLIGAYSFAWWPVSITLAVVISRFYLKFHASALVDAHRRSAQMRCALWGSGVGLLVSLLIFVPIARDFTDIGNLLEIEPTNLTISITIVTMVYGAACGWFLVTLFKERGTTRAN
ncbi:MAG: hypothetical protein O2910_06515 [Proteobacteria bacterium]|nr:hypothetical protein [Pseudomonadota bacterium]